MSTPVATVADALISFILSLLRDPAAVEEFDAAPKATLANHGLEDACAADVQAVKPVIVDNPTVIVKTVAAAPPRRNNDDDEVTREISRIVHQFTTIDARSTIVDQSVNQNIWTNGGDVTQIFDQDSVVASGDHAVAAGDDATVVDSDVDIDISDVSIGNTTVEGSFNENEVDVVVVEEEEPVIVEATDPAAAIAQTVQDTVDDAVDAAQDAGLEAAQDAAAVAQSVAPAEAQAPAEDPLAADLTSGDSYASDDGSSAVVDDAYIEEPIEEQ